MVGVEEAHGDRGSEDGLFGQVTQLLLAQPVLLKDNINLQRHGVTFLKRMDEYVSQFGESIFRTK